MNEYKITMNTETAAILLNGLQSEIECHNGVEPDVANNLKNLYRILWEQWENAVALENATA